MPITTGQWPDVYGNLKVEWGDEYNVLERVGEKLLKKSADKRKTAKASSAAFWDMARDKEEGQPFHEQDPKQGFAIVWEQTGLGTAITLTHEDFLFEQTIEMAEKVRGLAQSVFLREEHDIAMRLRYAGSTSYTNISGKIVSLALADTKALVADDHPIPADSSLTDDNDLDTLPFNRLNFIAGLQKFRTFRNEKALKLVGMNPKTVITSDSEEMAAAVDEVLFSKLDPESGNNRDNSLAKRGFQHLQIPNLMTDGTGTLDTTAQYYWFIADLMKTDFFKKVAEEAQPVFPKFDMADPNLPITGDHKVTVRGTNALYIRRYHWIVGSLATSLG